MAGISVQPCPHIIVVALLGPEHTRECLAHDAVRVFRTFLRKAARVKLVRFGAAQFERFFESRIECVGNAIFGLHVRQSQAKSGGGARRDLETIARGALCPLLCRIDGLLHVINHILMEAVFHIR